MTEVTVADGAAAFAENWIAGWTPPPPMSVAEWADANRILLNESSAEPGQWRTDRTPYLREPMDCLSPSSPVRDIALMKSSQVGGTEALINWICYVIGHHPCPMMVVLPTLDTAKAWSKQRLQPVIDATPALRRKVGPQTSRDPDDTVLVKKFPAGFLRIAGANSSASLRQMPVKYLAMDEIDEYEDDLNQQGSPIELALRRQTTFVRRKVLRVSTPTVKDASHIAAAFEEGDQRHYHVPCPHCAHEQVLEIDQLTDDGQYLCAGCGQLIAEHHKADMLAAGRWIPIHAERDKRSYHINALYSPIGLGDTWAEIARARLRARTDSDFEVIFVNTILGLPFAGAGQRVESNELLDRIEKWQRRTIPRGALILTRAIDVQHNRFAVMTCAWGRGEQCWMVDYVEVPGDPTREEDWAGLDEHAFEPIENSCGVSMRPSAIAIDSGNWTHEVYNWVRKHQTRGVFAIKGSNQVNRPVISRPVLLDVRDRRGRVHKHGVQLWTVGVHGIKSTLFARLVADGTLEPDDRRFHYPADMPKEVFDGLVAEHFDTRHKVWVKKSGARNEPWDCLVYNYAIACGPTVRLNVKREADWVALERKLEPGSADLFEARDDDAGDEPAAADPVPRETESNDPPAAVPRGTSKPPAPAATKRAVRPRRGSWMGGARP